MKTKRQQLIAQLLRDGGAASQTELVERLAEHDMSATQATVSRDLRDLGAVRRRRGGSVTYELPTRNAPPEGLGARLLPELVTDAVGSGSMAVIHTFPGMAATLAGILDGADVQGLLGTIAGDDTVFCVADETLGGAGLADAIKAMVDA